MKTIISTALLLTAAFMMSACGPIVEVPAAHVGKTKLESGFQEGVKEPSSFRLPFAWNYDPVLVIVEVSDSSVKESMKLFMPKDNLYLEFDIRGTFSIDPNPTRLEAIFDRVTSAQVPEDENVQKITFGKVYDTYGRQVVRSATREILAEYKIAEVMANREAISAKMMEAITERLKTTAISVRMFGLADVSPPEVIVAAQEKAKEREIAIQEAEANRLVKLTEADADLEVAKKQQEVDVLEAETQVMVQKVLDGSVSKAYIVQRALAAWQNLAVSGNKVVVVSSDIVDNPALMFGINSSGIYSDKGQ